MCLWTLAHWVNQELIKSMQWQELSELQHPIVKLGAELDLHFESWSQPVTIKNDATKEEIAQTCKEALTTYGTTNI